MCRFLTPNHSPPTMLPNASEASRTPEPNDQPACTAKAGAATCIAPSVIPKRQIDGMRNHIPWLASTHALPPGGLRLRQDRDNGDAANAKAPPLVSAMLVPSATAGVATAATAETARGPTMTDTHCVTASRE